MVIFHSYVRLPEGKRIGEEHSDLKKNDGSPSRTTVELVKTIVDSGETVPEMRHGA